MAARAGRTQKKTRAPVAAPKQPPRGEEAMRLEYLLVTFKEHRTVLADDTPVGITGHILMLPPGGYDITLEGDATTPADVQIDLMGTSIVRPKIVAFS
jgi:hypothetical protein